MAATGRLSERFSPKKLQKPEEKRSTANFNVKRLTLNLLGAKQDELDDDTFKFQILLNKEAHDKLMEHMKLNGTEHQLLMFDMLQSVHELYDPEEILDLLNKIYKDFVMEDSMSVFFPDDTKEKMKMVAKLRERDVNSSQVNAFVSTAEVHLLPSLKKAYRKQEKRSTVAQSLKKMFKN
ncbi:hypothetical protein AKO1_001074 [Acrasis kona]|uniref:Uncharacterized protein n=1 Tax=Acrasis kona TaxID=1008807 RepID=A0AAW2ZD43_9EUKA